MNDFNKGQGIDGERDPLDFSLELQSEAKLIQALKLRDFDKDEKLRADFLNWDAEERLKAEKNPSPMGNFGRMVKKLKLLVMAGSSYSEYMQDDLADIYTLAGELGSKASTFAQSEKDEFNDLMDQVDAINEALNPNPDQQ